LTYVTLYIAKTFIIDYFVMGYELETVAATAAIKGTTSAINGIIAVAASLLLNATIRPGLKRAGLNEKLGVQ
jgi:hypothetical protein